MDKSQLGLCPVCATRLDFIGRQCSACGEPLLAVKGHVPRWLPHLRVIAYFVAVLAALGVLAFAVLTLKFGLLL
jgi:predicted amidophosphoribosyltransferase